MHVKLSASLLYLTKPVATKLRAEHYIIYPPCFTLLIIPSFACFPFALSCLSFTLPCCTYLSLMLLFYLNFLFHAFFLSYLTLIRFLELKLSLFVKPYSNTHLFTFPYFTYVYHALHFLYHTLSYVPLPFHASPVFTCHTFC